MKEETLQLIIREDYQQLLDKQIGKCRKMNKWMNLDK